MRCEAKMKIRVASPKSVPIHLKLERKGSRLLRFKVVIITNLGQRQKSA